MYYLFTIFLVVVGLIHLYFANKSRSKLIQPPSPFRLPLIGHLHLLRKYPKEPWKAFDELSKKYGDVYEFQLGLCKYVIITSMEAAKEAIVKNGNSCLERPIITSWDLIVKGQQNSMHWSKWSATHQNLRKCLINTTQANLQTNYERLQELSVKGLEKFILSERPNQSVLLIEDLTSAYGQIAVDYFVGADFLETKSRDDEGWNKFCKSFVEIHDIAMEGHIMDALPFLRYFRHLFPTIRNLKKHHEILLGYVKNELGLEKMRDRIREEVPSDKDSLENLTFAELAIRKHLIDPQDLPWDKCYIMIGSFVANVVPLIYLTMLCLTNISFEKEYQEKMHREIQKAKSRSKDDIISLKEAKQFIYIKAALMEVVRIMSPPYIPRIVTQDIMVKGYHIPKGTGLMVNAYSSCHSSSIWESPERFMPQRFLRINDHGELEFDKPSDFYPFGLGRRSCPGYGLFENLAPQMIANIISRYEVSCDLEMSEMSSRRLDNYESFRVENSFCLRLKQRI